MTSRSAGKAPTGSSASDANRADSAPVKPARALVSTTVISSVSWRIGMLRSSRLARLRRQSVAERQRRFYYALRANAAAEGDGVVDAGDCTIWRNDIGEGCGCLTSVHEPRIAWLMVTG